MRYENNIYISKHDTGSNDITIYRHQSTELLPLPYKDTNLLLYLAAQ